MECSYITTLQPSKHRLHVVHVVRIWSPEKKRHEYLRGFRDRAEAEGALARYIATGERPKPGSPGAPRAGVERAYIRKLTLKSGVRFEACIRPADPKDRLIFLARQPTREAAQATAEHYLATGEKPAKQPRINTGKPKQPKSPRPPRDPKPPRTPTARKPRAPKPVRLTPRRMSVPLPQPIQVPRTTSPDRAARLAMIAQIARRLS